MGRSTTWAGVGNLNARDTAIAALAQQLTGCLATHAACWPDQFKQSGGQRRPAASVKGCLCELLDWLHTTMLAYLPCSVKIGDGM
jgi:hypothetical protein